MIIILRDRVGQIWERLKVKNNYKRGKKRFGNGSNSGKSLTSTLTRAPKEKKPRRESVTSQDTIKGEIKGRKKGLGSR